MQGLFVLTNGKALYIELSSFPFTTRGSIQDGDRQVERLIKSKSSLGRFPFIGTPRVQFKHFLSLSF